MRPLLVVVAAIDGKFDLRIREVVEDLHVEKICAKARHETLGESVLPGAPRLDESTLGAGLVRIPVKAITFPTQSDQVSA